MKFLNYGVHKNGETRKTWHHNYVVYLLHCLFDTFGKETIKSYEGDL